VQTRPKRPGIADVARAAGVSKTAVSFAFNTPSRLNRETAARIREIADALGYRPHPVARMLGQRRTGAIGILTPQALSVAFRNPFFATFAEGVAVATEASGYTLHFVSPVRGSLARAIGRAAVDGVVAVGLSARHPEVEAILRAGLPVVLVDSSPLAGHRSIVVDDAGGARAAAEHLVALGHRRFLVLGVEAAAAASGEDPDGVVGRRLAGYRSGLAAAGIELAPDLVVVGPATVDGGRRAFLDAWKQGARPTATLAMSDAMAIGAMRAVRDLGLSVPDDVSVVGFDDLDLAAFSDPALTTVHQPIREKAEAAARLLVSLIDGAAGEAAGSGGDGGERRLATRLVVRDSTAPPPRGIAGP
jgi:alanine racemase